MASPSSSSSSSSEDVVSPTQPDISPVDRPPYTQADPTHRLPASFQRKRVYAECVCADCGIEMIRKELRELDQHIGRMNKHLEEMKEFIKKKDTKQQK